MSTPFRARGVVIGALLILCAIILLGLVTKGSGQAALMEQTTSTLIPTPTNTDVPVETPATLVPTPSVIVIPTSPFDATATPLPTLTPLPTVTQQPVATNTPQPMPNSTYCEARNFTATPGRVKNGSVITLKVDGYCENGVRAIRFGIGNQVIAEIGSTSLEATYTVQNRAPGGFTIWAIVTNGNWETGARAELNVQVIESGDTGGQEVAPTANNCRFIGCQGQPGGETNPPATPLGTSCSTQKGLVTGDIALNTADLNLRSGSGTSYAVRITIPKHTLFTLIGGPQCGDGYVWWETQYGGLTGWVVEQYIIRNGDPIPSSPTPTPVPVIVIPDPGVLVIPLPGSPNEPEPVDPVIPVFPVVQTFEMRYAPFDYTYMFEVDTANCVILNGAGIIAEEIVRSRDSLVANWSEIIVDLPLYLSSGGHIDTFRVMVESFMIRKAGCLHVYYQVGSVTMDTSGLGNVMYGYYTIVLEEWQVHGFASILQTIKESRLQPDYPDDSSQIDLGRNIGFANVLGNELSAELVISRIPDNFESSR